LKTGRKGRSIKKTIGIEDPVGLPMKEFRRIRDIIEERVLELVRNSS